jgi:protein SCO1/2
MWAQGLDPAGFRLHCQTAGDRHTTEISLFDRHGRLAWRTSGLPPLAEVSDALKRLRG